MTKLEIIAYMALYDWQHVGTELDYDVVDTNRNGRGGECLDRLGFVRDGRLVYILDECSLMNIKKVLEEEPTYGNLKLERWRKAVGPRFVPPITEGVKSDQETTADTRRAP